ncbi:hypothetical protein [Limibacterium fermenti]|uniref:hypothetical protein n=1 Tax=Limibacterium fermenti TaxID=3229863 RepID=UPI000E9CF008|nr:hypothetical protein [Porphyromonadaceae bacterium]
MKISLSKQTNEGLGALGTSTVEATKTNGLEAALASPVYKTLETVAPEYNSKVLDPAFSGLGPEASAILRKSRKQFSSLNKIFKSLTDFPDTEKGKTAAALYLLSKAVGNVYAKTASETYLALLTFSNQINTEANAANVTAVGTVDEVAVFTKSVADLGKTRLEQSAIDSSLRSDPSATSLRPKLEDALKDYYSLLTGMRKQSGWDKLYSDISEVAAQAKRSARRGDQDEEKEKTK